jgi:hypothetical protein
MVRTWLGVVLGGVVLGSSGRAAAQAAPEAAQADAAEPAQADTRSRSIDRTWLYVDDARIPAPLRVIGMFDASYTNVGSPTRIGGTTALAGHSTYNALALNTAPPGAMIGLGGEIGLFPHVAIMTVVQVVRVTESGEAPTTSAGLIAGVRVQAFPSRWQNSHLVVSAGYLREAWQGPTYDGATATWLPGKPYGDSGVWAQVAFSQDLGRVRLASTVHAEHVFSAGRDPVDLMVQAGASCRIVGGFRLGVEYVGQDLEEAFDPEAEGGVRQFLGPVASLQILNDRLSIVAGPSFGLSRVSPAVLGRAGVAFGF